MLYRETVSGRGTFPTQGGTCDGYACVWRDECPDCKALWKPWPTLPVHASLPGGFPSSRQYKIP